nr:MAG TPA: hypothetical protein [Caudoviricetes sp.]
MSIFFTNDFSFYFLKLFVHFLTALYPQAPS